VLFNSFVFVGFFLVFYGAYLALMKQHRIQNLLLLLASWVFYAYWDWRFLGLLMLSSTIDYVAGLGMGASDDPKRRKRWLVASMVSNLVILGFFKYFDFFMGSLQDALGAFGLHPDLPFLRVALPVGISFYTFQSMSYGIDVYRREIEPVRDFLGYTTFVAFFPHMVAGPIQRAVVLLPQVLKPRKIEFSQVHAGLYLIAQGYLKKVVIADNAALVANHVFEHYTGLGGIDRLIGLLAFALQIYGDFSGYSDIARGISKLMGFELTLNFRLPYFAINPSDFWRRWHVSLSSWLRDYLYVPLGGNRGSEWKTYRNLALTMLLGGLWHGAAWHFVAWGAFHGLILILYRRFERDPTHPVPGTPAWKASIVLPKMVMMFALTLFAWLLFRSSSLHQAWDIVSGIGPTASADTAWMATRIAALWLPLLAFEIWQYRAHDLLVVTRLPAVLLTLFYFAIIVLIALFGSRTSAEFIYFQF
jgi:D-alanyl-lipoteichoic acid acyltransferase DltB (MBOAT superfamily)